MKKTLLFIISFVLLLSACDKTNKYINDPEKVKKILTGYWVYDMKINQNNVIPIVHLFLEDGNYTIANFLGATIQKNTWKINKNRLMIANKDNNQDAYELIIEKINDTEMTISNSKDNEKQLWKKGSATR